MLPRLELIITGNISFQYFIRFYQLKEPIYGFLDSTK